MIGKLALIMGMITTQREQSKAFGEEFIIASPCFLSFRIQIMHFSNMAIYFQYYSLVRTILWPHNLKNPQKFDNELADVDFLLARSTLAVQLGISVVLFQKKSINMITELHIKTSRLPF
jgi:hypothetical protein